MCGIFGILVGRQPTRSELGTIRHLFTELAAQSASRGRDAAGFAAIDDEGRSWVHKMTLSSYEQVRRGLWQGRLQNAVGRKTRSLMGHTRLGTHGPNTIENAHPHKFTTPHGALVGTHNGVIYNHHELTPLHPASLNDSANLFAFLAKHDEKRWPELLEKVQGWYALAMHRHDRLYFLRSGAPCWFAMVPDVGITIYASTAGILSESCREIGLEMKDVIEIPEHRMVITHLTGEVVAIVPVRAAWDDQQYWAQLIG